MPIIELPPLPGILALFAYKPTTAAPLKMLAEALLRGFSPLSTGERELIAAYVSRKNNCVFCYMSHAHTAAALLDTSFENIADIIHDPHASKISPRMKALLRIAWMIQADVADRDMDKALVNLAKAQGATSEEIHDTILISAAFCMYNRYVDGLGTEVPHTNDAYQEMGKHLALNGYVP